MLFWEVISQGNEKKAMREQGKVEYIERNPGNKKRKVNVLYRTGVQLGVDRARRTPKTICEKKKSAQMFFSIS